MHKKRLLLCTTTCALFFSYFNTTYTSSAFGLTPQTRHALDGLHHHSQKDFINTPTVETNNHKTMSSFGIVGKNPYFNQAIQDDLERERDRINSIFYSAGRSGSDSNQSELMDQLGHMYANALANQYNRDVLMNIHTATMEDLEILKMIASSGMVGEDSYFSQELREGLNRVQTDIIGKSSSENDHYSSDALQKAQSSVYARAMADQYDKDVQNMLPANAYLNQLQQNRLRNTENLLKNYEKALSDAAQAAVILEADNQERVNTERKQWGKQDNRNRHELQNKADMLHKAASVDNALQGQNKELSDTIRTAVRNPRNTDTTKNAKDKNNVPATTNREVPLQPKGDKDLQANINPKTNTSSPSLKTTLKSPPNDMTLPAKVDASNQTATKTENGVELANDKETTALSHTLTSSEAKIKALTAQIASYAVMPHALLATGIADVNNQNILLDKMRITLFEANDNKEKGFFFSTYGEKMTLFSHPPSPQKSADADIRYAALQAGLSLITLENQNTSTNFGLLGTYGKLAFTPKNTQTSQKNMLDKWSLTAYGNIQHDSGIYASAFLSYGIFKADITSALSKNTEKVSNTKTLGVSATIGQKLPTMVKGIILEPQAELSYQRLMLGILSDAKSFKIYIEKPYQWLLRIGGRLTQNTGDAVSFYGKLNAINTFGKNMTLQIGKKSFQFSPLETCLEGGLGVNANLSPNIVLHGDVSYQHKLKKVGISGIYVSAGMRYRF
ncbi:autotransporter outer membrane beta-barrel domain-containing protein [Bartonella florencae]|uniref:autotransporter outer membrane beta-barrel domain-containing protein n=1 Tax=Bartonella florencae TaxID=928210 RepID=UPI0002EC38B3|nr:autotransporter outer membrane beta-barrel domain-containing protein [Bartonella florencae]